MKQKIDEILSEVYNGNQPYTEYLTDKAIVKDILKIDISAFQFVPIEFKTKNLCLFACQQHPSAYLYVPEKYSVDKDILECVLSKWGDGLRYCPYQVQNNKRYAKMASYTDLSALRYCSGRLKKDRKFCGEMVSYNPKAIKYFDTFKADKKIGFFILREYPKYAYLLDESIIRQYEKENNLPDTYFIF